MVYERLTYQILPYEILYQEQDLCGKWPEGHWKKRGTGYNTEEERDKVFAELEPLPFRRYKRHTNQFELDALEKAEKRREASAMRDVTPAADFGVSPDYGAISFVGLDGSCRASIRGGNAQEIIDGLTATICRMFGDGDDMRDVMSDIKSSMIPITATEVLYMERCRNAAIDAALLDPIIQKMREIL